MQIQHTSPRPATESAPLSALRAQVLALCTIDVQTAVTLVRRPRGRGAITRTIQWLECSYLMRKVEGGWKLTATGEAALRASFRACMLGWPRCAACKRQKPKDQFLSASGAPTINCMTCRSLTWTWKQ